MNQLDISRINALTPYKVWEQEDGLNFETDFGVRYAVDFDDDANPYYTAYWFNLKNKNKATSPSDKKVEQTIVCIIDEFFRRNPDILLYMCSTTDGRQAQRSRLFLRWFNGAEQQKRYAIRSAEIHGENNRMEYVALIVERSNPHLDEILSIFDEETAMFDELKP